MRLTLLCSLAFATFLISISMTACVGRSFPETLGFPLFSVNATCVSDTADVCATEGSGVMQVEVLMSRTFESITTVSYVLADIGSAEIDVDFEAQSGTLIFPPGTTSQTVTIVLLDDDEDEDDEDAATDDEEKFEFRLDMPTGGALISSAVATCEINDDDVTSLFSVVGGTVNEGALDEVTELTFVVSLTPALIQDATVVYTTSDNAGVNPATEGSDYRGSSGTLTFLAGETTKNVTILVNGDDAPEAVGGSETFDFTLSTPLPGNFTDLDPIASSAVGTITDDDGNLTGGTTLYVDSPSALENGDLVYTIHALPAAVDDISISYSTGTPPTSGGATPSLDYTTTPLGTLQILTGETSGTFTIDVLDDVDVEVNEIVTVDLTRTIGTANFLQDTATGAFATANGSILNDDVPFIGVGDAGIMEGDVVAVTANTIRVPVDLVTADGEPTTFGSTTQPATVFVDYATSVPTTTHDDPATEGTDYTATSGTIVFNPGEQTQFIDIPVIPDRTWEPNESIDITLTANADSPSSAALATILNGANADFTTSLARIVDDEPGYDFNGDGELDIAIGAPKVDDAGTDRGKIYIFLGPFNGAGAPNLSAATDAEITITGEFDDDQLSRITIGDFDGDGLDDLACGAPGEESAGTEGRVFMYFGNAGASVIGQASPASAHVAGDTAATWDVSILGDATDGDTFGQQLSCIGDANGDGFEDILISDPRYIVPVVPATTLLNGQSYLFYGGPSLSGALDVTNADISILSAAADLTDSEGIGLKTSRAGDVDGDGLGDYLIASRFSDGAGLGQAGRAYVFTGARRSTSSSIDTSSALVTFEGQAVGESFGESVSNIGDVNGDGLDDVAVGTHLYPFTTAFQFTGRVYIFYSTVGMTGTVSGAVADVIIESDAPSTVNGDAGEGMGFAIRGLGDFNGDDADDFAVTALGWWRSITPANGDMDMGGTFSLERPSGRGRCYVFAGGATNFPTGTPITLGDSVTVTNPTANSVAYLILNGGDSSSTTDLNQEEMGKALGAIGDLDGDGLTDLLVASTYTADDSDAKEAQGRVYVLSGIDSTTQAGLGQKDLNSNDSLLWIIEAENTDLNDDGMGGVLAVDPVLLEIGDQFGDSMSR